MTAYVDFTFQTATSGAGTGTAPLGWVNPELALSQPSTGAATLTEAAQVAAAFTPAIEFSGFALPAGLAAERLSGIAVDLWLSSNHNSPNPASLIAGLDFRGGAFPAANPTPSALLTNWGVYPNGSNTPPVNPTTYGGETDLWGFASGFTLDQLTPLSLRISGLVIAPPTSRVFSIWNVRGRVWLDAPSMQDIVERAYRKLAILSKDTTIEADDLSYGLQSLNDMLFGWEIFGVDIGHVERQAGEAFPIARKFVEATSMQLAERLSPDYQVPAMSSQRFFAALQREYNNVAQSDWRDLDGDGTVQDDEADAADRSEFY